MMKKTPDANLAQLAGLANCQNTKIFFLLIWQSNLNPAMPECQNARMPAGPARPATVDDYSII